MNFRPVAAEIDLGAIRANVATLAACAAGTPLMAVVKADAYGHGAAEVARAALDAGASWLGVALVEEGVSLREAGIDAPMLVLSEPPLSAADAVVEHSMTPVVYREVWVDALAASVARAERRQPLPVHLKVDTGMHRAGCDIGDAVGVAKAISAHSALTLEGLMTHLAVADEPGHPATRAQLDAFEAVWRDVADSGISPPIVHSANSAATLALPEAHYSLVRCGIALYGVPPAPGFEALVELQPAMTFRAEVAQVRRVPAGEAVSYGLRYRLDRPATIAVVPVGYADGVPRRLGHRGGEVLVGGIRRPIAGTITMDQLMVDCGDDPVQVGDEVVLIGRQGSAQITASEWAHSVETIPYEITCGVGSRVPRTYIG